MELCEDGTCEVWGRDGRKTGERYRGLDERFLLLQVKKNEFYTLGNRRKVEIFKPMNYTF